ncbi:unnamed protein product [Haemonchus placei]|uniref:UV-stimulated scaffold protein A n=1 Tax=Haemonchus placei TaxID=6290 RepID=A0A0N4WXE5_HAEPC|nr:unnamed protein product [Haemonchus placei]
MALFQAVYSSKKTVFTDSQEFKKLKKEIRENENALAEYVDYLFTSLKCPDSEQRQALLSIFDYFFNRSHKFRLRIVEKLQELLLLVCETDPFNYPLPGPSKERKELKAYALKTVKQWHEKFGPGYEKLNFVSDFLRKSKAVDFDAASEELLAERRRKEAENRRIAELSQKIASIVRRKLDEVKGDIERCIASADTALSILVPLFCIDSEQNEAKNRGTASCRNNDQDMKTVHGYTNSDTIPIVLESLTPEVTINEDNEAVIENLRDVKVMLELYRNKILSWQRKLNGAVGVELLMRDLTAIKRKIDQRCGKIAELNLKPKRRKRKSAHSSESEESDLEDVLEKQLEEFKPPDDVRRHNMERVKQEVEDGECFEQACCSKSLVTTPSLTTPKEELEDEVKPKPNIPLPSCEGVGESKPTKRRCNARLPNGKLCPRMGLRKCPLHGKIVDRDDEGFPLEQLETTEKSTSQVKREHQEEEEYLRDLEVATGKSFVGKFRKKKRRESSVRERLEKKILDPRAVKRVLASLDAACRARQEWRFGDQFVHSITM